MRGEDSQSDEKRRPGEVCAAVEDIRFPDAGALAQDAEWCEVRLRDGATRRIRFHDYHKVYRIPGLYEQLFYKKLKCNSPARVVGMLNEVVRDFGEDVAGSRVLDLGAGNGMVGEELQELGVQTLVGVDIIDEARQAVERDRPDVYDEYHVADFTDLPEHLERHLRHQNFNVLSTVAALGFGDIPAKAFLKALDLLETPGWLAFNIKEGFLHEEDHSDFGRLIRHLSRECVIQIQAYRRYCHRLSICGKPLYYVAMIARKLKDVPDELMAD